MTAEFDNQYASEQLRRRRSWLRRIVKELYLHNLLRLLPGKTVDLGCGAGQLLERLPAGSIGLEVNPSLVRTLASMGLSVRLYDAMSDDFSLGVVERDVYKHLVCSHVIEHFADPAASLRKLGAACDRLGIASMIFVVPGLLGFLSDPTHKTFVTEQFIDDQQLRFIGPYQMSKPMYFPGNWESLGRLYRYHECILTWHRK